MAAATHESTGLLKDQDDHRSSANRLRCRLVMLSLGALGVVAAGALGYMAYRRSHGSLHHREPSMSKTPPRGKCDGRRTLALAQARGDGAYAGELGFMYRPVTSTLVAAFNARLRDTEWDVVLVEPFASDEELRTWVDNKTLAECDALIWVGVGGRGALTAAQWAQLSNAGVHTIFYATEPMANCGLRDLEGALDHVAEIWHFSSSNAATCIEQGSGKATHRFLPPGYDASLDMLPGASESAVQLPALYNSVPQQQVFRGFGGDSTDSERRLGTDPVPQPSLSQTTGLSQQPSSAATTNSLDELASGAQPGCLCCKQPIFLLSSMPDEREQQFLDLTAETYRACAVNVTRVSNIWDTSAMQGLFAESCVYGSLHKPQATRFEAFRAAPILSSGGALISAHSDALDETDWLDLVEFVDGPTAFTTAFCSLLDMPRNESWRVARRDAFRARFDPGLLLDKSGALAAPPFSSGAQARSRFAFGVALVPHGESGGSRWA